MRIKLISAALLLGLSTTVLADETVATKQLLERGRYLVSTSGCNDCHTPGYPESGGKIAISNWLTGSSVGFQGPWGTTYPVNLRLLVQTMSEQEWLERARQPRRPPMPWFSLRDMNDDDLKAMYQFMHSLGPQGEPAPSYAEPGQQVKTPYIVFVPQNLPKQAEAK